MPVYAASTIQHGVGNEVHVYEVGDELDDLTPEEIRPLIAAGSAKEYGGNEYEDVAPETNKVLVDPKTSLRDAILDGSFKPGEKAEDYVKKPEEEKPQTTPDEPENTTSDNNTYLAPPES